MLRNAINFKFKAIQAFLGTVFRFTIAKRKTPALLYKMCVHELPK